MTFIHHLIMNAILLTEALRYVWHVVTRFYLSTTLIHEWNEPSCLYAPATVPHHTLACTHYSSR